MKWYRQPAIWAVIIAALALTLSQLPPVKEWFPRKDLAVEIGSTIGFPTNVGSAGYWVLVDLENRGNRDIYLSTIQLTVTRPNKSTDSLDVSWYNPPGEQQSYAPTTIRLRPEERWISYLSFYRKMTPSEDEQIGRLKQAISRSVFESRQAFRARGGSEETVITADDALVREAYNLFNQRLVLETGPYTAVLSYEDNGQRINLKTFEFTLYDYHIRTLHSQAEDLKYGWGVISDPDLNKQLNVTVNNAH